MNQSWYPAHTFNGDSSWFGGVRSLSINPSRQIIGCGSDDNTIRLWDLNNGQLLSYPFEHTKSVRSISFTPKGNGLISGGDDATIRVWDLRTSQELLTFNAHSQPVTAVAVVPIYDFVVSGSDDYPCCVTLGRGKIEIRVSQGYKSRIGKVINNRLEFSKSQR
ncbi:WD40 repeat domain-containing protein [Nostoc punctiforme]|uniref:WD40 repeat domain-containing protein n=1 Tax=Nostoc punctiforme TaxID=272131 RepID=UPI000038CB26|nr:hypothetical protein [Nostoc punctiforme]